MILDNKINIRIGHPFCTMFMQNPNEMFIYIYSQGKYKL